MKHYTITWDNDSNQVENFNVESINPLTAVMAYADHIVNVLKYYTSADIREVKPDNVIATITSNGDVIRVPPNTSVFDKDDGLQGVNDNLPKTNEEWSNHLGLNETSDNIVPAYDQFLTPMSSWINKVTWKSKNTSICVWFNNGSWLVYNVRGYDLFESFRDWVALNGSAGKFYNSNVKSQFPVLKSKTISSKF